MIQNAYNKCYNNYCVFNEKTPIVLVRVFIHRQYLKTEVHIYIVVNNIII